MGNVQAGEEQPHESSFVGIDRRDSKWSVSD